jgi:hypothetical protein
MVIVALCGGGGGAAVPIAAVVATVMSDGTVKVKGKGDEMTLPEIWQKIVCFFLGHDYETRC